MVDETNLNFEEWLLRNIEKEKQRADKAPTIGEERAYRLVWEALTLTLSTYRSIPEKPRTFSEKDVEKVAVHMYFTKTMRDDWDEVEQAFKEGWLRDARALLASLGLEPVEQAEARGRNEGMVCLDGLPLSCLAPSDLQFCMKHYKERIAERLRERQSEKPIAKSCKEPGCDNIFIKDNGYCAIHDKSKPESKPENPYTCQDCGDEHDYTKMAKKPKPVKTTKKKDGE